VLEATQYSWIKYNVFLTSHVTASADLARGHKVATTTRVWKN
jgi:hypothetical protein